MELNDYRNLFDMTPCRDAREWLNTQPDIQTAWNACVRGDWMWWALMHSNSNLTQEQCVEFANNCVIRAKQYAAADADAYAAAYAAADAAAYAAADAAYAAYAAAYAADAAADAAAYAAADAAAYAERKLQADWIRKHILYPF